MLAECSKALIVQGLQAFGRAYFSAARWCKPLPIVSAFDEENSVASKSMRAKPQCAIYSLECLKAAVLKID